MVHIQANYSTNIALVNTKHYCTLKPLNTLPVPNATSNPSNSRQKSLFIDLVLSSITQEQPEVESSTLTFLFLC